VSVGSPDRASSASITASNIAGSDHLLELAERSVPFASNVVLGRILAERDVVWVLENEEHLETTLSRWDGMIGAWRFRAGLTYLAAMRAGKDDRSSLVLMKLHWRSG